tara:strand:- start:57 stop:227 length:171 start_codon:yes stop_codon:yes gene_type:complete
MRKNQLDKQGYQDGYWEVYHLNGMIFSKGNYVNGQLHGFWEFYCSNGKLWHKAFYI